LLQKIIAQLKKWRKYCFCLKKYDIPDVWRQYSFLKGNKNIMINIFFYFFLLLFISFDNGKIYCMDMIRKFITGGLSDDAYRIAKVCANEFKNITIENINENNEAARTTIDNFLKNIAAYTKNDVEDVKKKKKEIEIKENLFKIIGADKKMDAIKSLIAAREKALTEKIKEPKIKDEPILDTFTKEPEKKNEIILPAAIENSAFAESTKTEKMEITEKKGTVWGAETEKVPTEEEIEKKITTLISSSILDGEDSSTEENISEEMMFKKALEQKEIKEYMESKTYQGLSEEDKEKFKQSIKQKVQSSFAKVQKKMENMSESTLSSTLKSKVKLTDTDNPSLPSKSGEKSLTNITTKSTTSKEEASFSSAATGQKNSNKNESEKIDIEKENQEKKIKNFFAQPKRIIHKISTRKIWEEEENQAATKLLRSLGKEHNINQLMEIAKIIKQKNHSKKKNR